NMSGPAARSALGPVRKRLTDLLNEISGLQNVPLADLAAQADTIRTFRFRLERYSATYLRMHGTWEATATTEPPELDHLKTDEPVHLKLITGLDDGMVLLLMILEQIERSATRPPAAPVAAPAPPAAEGGAAALPTVSIKLPTVDLMKFDGDIFSW